MNFKKRGGVLIGGIGISIILALSTLMFIILSSNAFAALCSDYDGGFCSGLPNAGVTQPTLSAYGCNYPTRETRGDADCMRTSSNRRCWFITSARCSSSEVCTATGCQAPQPPAPRCGDGSCNGGETCGTCSQDCGACPSAQPQTPPQTQQPPTQPPSSAGGTPCGSGETCINRAIGEKCSAVCARLGKTCSYNNKWSDQPFSVGKGAGPLGAPGGSEFDVPCTLAPANSVGQCGTWCAGSIPINGACGTSNNFATSSSPPTSGRILCSAGTASGVLGGTISTIWVWFCRGSNGGSDATCTAPVNGECGSANGAATSSVPSANLCNRGRASAVSGAGPWSWTCSGQGTGAVAASCSAPQLEIGRCGTAHEQTRDTQPSGSILCSSGIASAVATTTTQWAWTCSANSVAASCYSNRNLCFGVLCNTPPTSYCGSGNNINFRYYYSGTGACSLSSERPQCGYALFYEDCTATGKVCSNGNCQTPSCQGNFVWSGNCVDGWQPGTCSNGFGGTISTRTYCRGDFDRNNCVDMKDFKSLEDVFDTTNSLSVYDIDKDGRVDIDDFFAFALDFGSCQSGRLADTIPIPLEPDPNTAEGQVRVGEAKTFYIPGNVGGNWIFTTEKKDICNVRKITPVAFGVIGVSPGQCTSKISLGGQEYTRTIAILANGAPTNPFVSFQEQTYYIDSTLTAVAKDSIDPEKIQITYSYRFMRGNDLLRDWSSNNQYACNAVNCPIGSKIKAYARAYDGALYSGESSAETQISNRKPVLRQIGSKSINENQKLQFTVSAADAEGSQLAFSTSTLPQGASFNPSTQIFAWTPSFAQSGNYNARFEVTDGFDKTYEDVAISVGNTNRAPSANSQSVSTNEDTPVIITLTGNDDDQNRLTYSVSNPSNGVIINFDKHAGTVTYRPFTNFNGQDGFTFSVNDGTAESASALVTIAIKPVNDPPVATTAGGPYFGNNGEEIKISGSGSDSENGPLTYLWESSDCQVGNLKDTAAVCSKAGTFPLALKVSDDKGAISNAVKTDIRVNPKPEIPEFGISPPSCKSGQKVKLQCKAVDNDYKGAKESASSLKVYGWLGTCKDINCNGKSWNEGGPVFLRGVQLRHVGNDVFESDEVILDAPKNTLIAATCTALDKENSNREPNLKDPWSDKYPLCALDSTECASNPKITIPTITPAHTGVGKILIQFQSDRLLSKNPDVSITKRGTTSLVGMATRRDTTNDNDYIYDFDITEDTIAGDYIVHINGEDSNGCKGGIDGSFSVERWAKIIIDGTESGTVSKKVDLGETSFMDVEWNSNIAKPKMTVSLVDGSDRIEVFSSAQRSGKQRITDLSTGDYEIKTYDMKMYIGNSMPAPNVVADITGFQTVIEGQLTPDEVERRNANIDDNIVWSGPGTAPPPGQPPSGGLLSSGKSLFIKLDSNDEDGELIRFLWNDKNYRTPDDNCEIYLEEENDWGGKNHHAVAQFKFGSLIKVKGRDIIDGNSGSYVDCERISDKPGGEACQIPSQSFRQVSESKCDDLGANGNCGLARNRKEFRPRGDILCSNENGDIRWYLCNQHGAKITAGGKKYECVIGQDNIVFGAGEWVPFEDCSNRVDDDGDKKIDCADEDCYKQEFDKDTCEPGINCAACEPDYHSSSETLTRFNGQVCRYDGLYKSEVKFGSEKIRQFFSFSRFDYGYDFDIKNPPQYPNKCCGDDNEDGGFIDLDSANGDKLCYINKGRAVHGRWETASESNHGKVFYSTGAKTTPYIAYGKEWLKCDGDNFKNSTGQTVAGDLFIPKISKHFLCAKEGDEPVVKICCGEKTDNCRVDYVDEKDKLITGQNITKGGRNYYCTEQAQNGEQRKETGIFITELDPESADNIGDRYMEAKKACEALKDKYGKTIAAWTGTKCCGEPAPDDPHEYYNDPDNAEGRPQGSKTGGCWDSKFKESAKIVEQIEEKYKNFFLSNKGAFLGCVPEQSKAEVQGILDSHKNEQLAALKNPCSKNKDKCANSDLDCFLCYNKKNWELLSGFKEKEYDLSPSHSDPENKECCVKNEQCWDGSGCVNNQYGQQPAVDNPLGKEMRCINGKWVELQLKKGLVAGQGYCPSNDMCLVNPQGKFEDNGNDDPNKNPQCLKQIQSYYGAGSYGKDANFCVAGEWQSRAKITAARLLKHAGDYDFMMYCDEGWKALNSQSPLSDVKAIADNICLINQTGSVTVGIALKSQISDQSIKTAIKNAFGTDADCSPKPDWKEGVFSECIPKGKTLWYNPLINSIIYNKKGISLNENIGDEAFAFVNLVYNDPENLIVQPMKPILEEFNAKPEDVKYSRIYLSKSGNKRIYGFTSGASVGARYEYEGTEDICQLANADAENKITGNEWLFCNLAKKTIYGTDPFPQSNPERVSTIFADLTANLRHLSSESLNVQNQLAQTGGLQPAAKKEADFNDDGKIDDGDYRLFNSKFGKKVSDPDYRTYYRAVCSPPSGMDTISRSLYTLIPSELLWSRDVLLLSGNEACSKIKDYEACADISYFDQKLNLWTSIYQSECSNKNYETEKLSYRTLCGIAQTKPNFYYTIMPLGYSGSDACSKLKYGACQSVEIYQEGNVWQLSSKKSCQIKLDSSWQPKFDLDNSGIVDNEDFFMLSQDYGKMTGS